MRKLCLGIVALSLLCGCSSSKTAVTSTVKEETQYSCRSINYYDYSKAVPESDTADDTYWSTVFMGGDSRMGSIALFSNLRDKGADVQYAESLSLYRIYDMNVENGDTPLYDLMMNTDRTNIYILLGLNEIRNDDFSDWEDMYDTVVQDLRKKNPDVNIYLMSSYHCTDVSGLSEDELTAHLENLNSKILDLAEKEHCYYLDTNTGITGDNGVVKSELVWDGIHLNTDGSQMFADEIAKHVVQEETYVKKVCQ